MINVCQGSQRKTESGKDEGRGTEELTNRLQPRAGKDTATLKIAGGASAGRGRVMRRRGALAHCRSVSTGLDGYQTVDPWEALPAENRPGANSTADYYPCHYHQQQRRCFWMLWSGIRMRPALELLHWKE
ncbi:unnamed protein product [Pleuronectes platessa]|uniref:Uncharacterized protein n=1 Tax=Pleuronectes platessa TaxID=8262 RepID=A0A9N7V2G2_PLEPL|nr:unnamed protein product [Pleuronectes platessa]